MLTNCEKNLPKEGKWGQKIADVVYTWPLIQYDITRLVRGDEGERDEQRYDRLAEVPPGGHPDERGQRQEVDERHVGLERLLQVLPVELDAPRAHPQEQHAGQQEVGERPAQTRHHDLKRQHK